MGVLANVALGLAILCKVAAAFTSCENLKKLGAFEHCTASPETTDGKIIIMVQVGDGFTDFFENWFLYAKPFINPDCMTVLAVVDDHPTMATLNARKEEMQWHIDIVSGDAYQATLSLASVGIHGNTTYTESSASGGSKTHQKWDYNDTSYLTSMSLRPRVLNHYLLQQCTILFSDIDIVWRKNVFRDMMSEARGPSANMYAVSDSNLMGDQAKNFCGGFLFVNPTPWSLKVVQEWSDKLTANPGRNQPILNEIIKRSGVEKVVQLPQEKYLNGATAESTWVHASAVHANWMIGKEAKKKFLQDRGMWQVPAETEQPAEAAQSNAEQSDLEWYGQVDDAIVTEESVSVNSGIGSSGHAKSVGTSVMFAIGSSGQAKSIVRRHH